MVEKENGGLIANGFVLPNRILSRKRSLVSFMKDIGWIMECAGIHSSDLSKLQQQLCNETKCKLKSL